MEEARTIGGPVSSTTDILAQPFQAMHQLSPYFKSLGFHSHDFYEVYLFLSGRVSYYIEDAGYNLVPGDVLIIPPGSMHRPVTPDPNIAYERCYLWIGAETLRSLQDSDCPFIEIFESCSATSNYLIHFDGEKLKQFKDIFQNIVDLNATQEPAWNLSCRAYLTLLFIAVCKEITAGRSVLDQTHKNGIVPKVIMYINEHITEDLNLDAISDEFFISKYHLIREFKKYTNKTLYAYIISKRIIISKQLIQQGVLPTKACFSSGFNNYSNFYKAFVSETGMTPKEFVAASLY